MKILKKIIARSRILSTISIIFYVFRIFKIQNNKIIMNNFNGKGYGDSPKYIAEQLLNSNIYKLYWGVKDKNKGDFPNGIIPVKMYSLSWFYHMATAKIWISNLRYSVFVKKRKNQYYIQTWHGGLGIKKIEYDAYEKMTYYYKQVMENDNRMIDLMLSNGKWMDRLCRNAFRYKGEILSFGLPKNDMFINRTVEYSTKVKKFYGIDASTKLLLYAPTFRVNYDSNPYNIDFDRLVQVLDKKTGFSWRALVRLHPKVTEKYDELITLNNNGVNASSYSDAQELVCASDLLISDFSSILFDGMMAKKPVVVYADDLKKYADERGLYFNITDLPFEIAENYVQLETIIRERDFTEMLNRYGIFEEDIGLKETGESSVIVSRRIKEIVSSVD